MSGKALLLGLSAAAAGSVYLVRQARQVFQSENQCSIISKKTEDEFFEDWFFSAETSNVCELTKILKTDPFIINKKNRTGYTALHVSVDKRNLEAVQALLQGRANPNCQTNEGLTPLHLSVYDNSLEITRQLLAYKAQVTLCCNSGNTPLHTAARYNRIQIAPMLLTDVAVLKWRNNEGLSPLKRAEAFNMVDMMIFLENCENQNELKAKNTNLESELMLLKQKSYRAQQQIVNDQIQIKNSNSRLLKIQEEMRVSKDAINLCLQFDAEKFSQLVCLLNFWAILGLPCCFIHYGFVNGSILLVGVGCVSFVACQLITVAVREKKKTVLDVTSVMDSIRMSDNREMENVRLELENNETLLTEVLSNNDLKIARLENSLEEQAEVIKKRNGQLASLGKRVHGLQAELEVEQTASKSREINLQGKNEEAAQKLIYLGELLSNKDLEIAVLKESVTRFQSALETQQAEVKKSEVCIEQKNEQLACLGKRVEGLKTELVQQRAKIQKENKNLELALHQSSVTKLQTELEERRVCMLKQSGQLASLEKKVVGLQNELEVLQREKKNSERCLKQQHQREVHQLQQQQREIQCRLEQEKNKACREIQNRLELEKKEVCEEAMHLSREVKELKNVGKCHAYLRTGVCKSGSKCKYEHANEFFQQRIRELESELKTVKIEALEEKEGEKCCVCLVENKTVVVLPCSHYCLCQTCASQNPHAFSNACPICRHPINSFLPVYL